MMCHARRRVSLKSGLLRSSHSASNLSGTQQIKRTTMAGNNSFDVTTGADLQEVDNAVNQALKEVAQRYDFKGSHCNIAFDRTKAKLTLDADDEYKMNALFDVLQT